MRISVIAAMLVALGYVTICEKTAAAPRPAPVAGAWELQIKIERPEPIEIYLPNEAKPKLFWYMRYTLTNQTGEKQIFVPEFLLYTDTGQVLRAGRRIPTAVFNAIKTHHNVPLLKNMTSMTGIILHGADNAKQGVAIWPDFDPKAGRFDIFVGGLSGETAEINLPSPVGKTAKLILAKTWNLTYTIAGQAAARIDTPVIKKAEKWIMR